MQDSIAELYIHIIWLINNCKSRYFPTFLEGRGNTIEKSCTKSYKILSAIQQVHNLTLKTSVIQDRKGSRESTEYHES